MFVICTACQRHVKRGETACPFCSARVIVTEIEPRPGVPSTTWPARSRLALLFGGVTAGTTLLAACGIGSSSPFYGGPWGDEIDAETQSPYANEAGFLGASDAPFHYADAGHVNDADLKDTASDATEEGDGGVDRDATD